ncbi:MULTISPECIES: hypothetical protein [unclassified Flavobacterium]|uniref:hypothetical protein n=1 Tax=unclassified Flavobacterium TaxID=196869 RepID=UPI001F12A18C|nr:MULTISPECIES: hypothetical protein [unclassified Flavobacterium]UMY65234.1 hypothetical protein MKO97_12080 [Flavobacterium sp. HJ-32-4]
MKRIPSNVLYVVLLISGSIALYEQSGSQPRLFVVIPSIAVFLLGLMALSSRIPSKNKSEDDPVQ